MNKNHLNKVDIPLITTFGSLQPDDLDEFHFMSIGLFLVQRIIKHYLSLFPRLRDLWPSQLMQHTLFSPWLLILVILTTDKDHILWNHAYINQWKAKLRYGSL